MTLQQLKYVVKVAEKGNITEAAKELFISQPSLTNAVHELENEMQVTIFERTNKGVVVTRTGDEFFSNCAMMRGRFSSRLICWRSVTRENRK